MKLTYLTSSCRIESQMRRMVAQSGSKRSWLVAFSRTRRFKHIYKLVSLVSVTDTTLKTKFRVCLSNGGHLPSRESKFEEFENIPIVETDGKQAKIALNSTKVYASSTLKILSRWRTSINLTSESVTSL